MDIMVLPWHVIDYHKNSSSRDMLLVYYVTSQNDTIKGLCDFNGGSPSALVTTLNVSVAIDAVVVEI